MPILRSLFWSLARRAAADPRMRKKAGHALRAVDRGMDKAADKVAQVATAPDPAREAGRMVGDLLSSDSDAGRKRR